MQLDEFYDYKNLLMKTLCSNPEIVRLVTDSKEAPVPHYDLAYTQLFPFEFIPDTVGEGMTFICFDVDIDKVYSAIKDKAVGRWPVEIAGLKASEADLDKLYTYIKEA